MMTTTTLASAIDYALRGWYVFLIQPAPNKRPVTEHGFLDATLDPNLIAEWWTAYPTAQIGIACGPSGLMIVDLDEKPQLFTSGKASLDTIGVDADTACNLIMRTPSNGGRQLFFKDTQHTRRLGVLPGVDLLGDGGYTIVPSKSSPNREWVVGDAFDPDDLDPLPTWAIALCTPKVSRGTSVAVSVMVVPLVAEEERRIVEALACIPNDERQVWIDMGMALKSTGAGEQAFAIWESWSRGSSVDLYTDHPSYDAKDQRYQWERLHALKMDGSEITLGTLFHLAKQHGYGAQPATIILSSPGLADEVVSGEGTPGHDPGGPGGGVSLTQTPTQQERVNAPGSTEVALDATPVLPNPDAILLMEERDVSNLPMVKWMVRGLIPERSIVLLAGDTMMGKSFLAIDLAMRLKYGKEFMGRRTKPCSVLYLCGEGQAGMSARFRLWSKEHGVLPIESDGRYVLVSNRIPELNAKSVVVLREMLESIKAKHGSVPGLVVVDTLSQALDGDENDSSTLAPVLRAIARLRDEFGCSILIVHHTVKRAQTQTFTADGKERWQPLTLNQVRGSGAITRNIDAVLGIHTSKDNPEIFELITLKQKDGSLGKPVLFRREIFPTGRQDEEGQLETSCILVLIDEERAPVVYKDPQVVLEEKQDEGIRRLVAALRKEGRIGARDSVVLAAGLKTKVGRAYLDLAISRGEIIITGSLRRPLHVLPGDSIIPAEGK